MSKIFSLCLHEYIIKLVKLQCIMIIVWAKFIESIPEFELCPLISYFKMIPTVQIDTFAYTSVSYREPYRWQKIKIKTKQKKKLTAIQSSISGRK